MAGERTQRSHAASPACMALGQAVRWRAAAAVETGASAPPLVPCTPALNSAQGQQLPVPGPRRPGRGGQKRRLLGPKEAAHGELKDSRKAKVPDVAEGRHLQSRGLETLKGEQT